MAIVGSRDNISYMDFSKEMCCPKDKELRKELSVNIKNEYKQLEKDSKEITKIIKILANKYRIQILLIVNQRKLCIEEIIKILNLKKSTLSYHIKILIQEGMISKERHSIYTYLTITEYGKNLFIFKKYR